MNPTPSTDSARGAGSKKNVEAIYGLTPLQQGMLFHNLLEPEAGLYNAQLHCTLDGPLDAGAFREAWRRTLGRHEILRTCFLWERLEKPVQVVQLEVELPWQELDWQHLDEAAQGRELAAWLEADRRRGFDLRRAPLMRVTLIQLAPQRHVTVWSNHHILVDGWSLPLVLRDVLGVYGRLALSGEAPQLPRPRPFRDFLEWLRRQERGEAEAFWRHALDGVEPASPPPLGRPARPAAGAAKPETFPQADLELADVELRLTPAATAALEALARRHGWTLNTVVQGGWGLLLARHAGRTDVVFGASVAGRPAELAGVEEMVGLFLNTVPVRVSCPPEARLRPWLDALQARQVELRRFEHTSLADAQAWSGLPSGEALFNTLLVFENYPVLAGDESLAASGLALGPVQSAVFSNYPLSLLAVPGADGLLLRLKFHGRHCGAAEARLLVEQLARLLEQVAEGGDPTLAELSLVTPSTRGLLADPSRPLEVPELPLLPSRLAAQARATPDALALVEEGNAWTYAELVARVEALASRLLAAGLLPGDRVAVVGPRSPGLVAAATAVLAAGGVLLLIDPALPGGRRERMLEAAEPRLELWPLPEDGADPATASPGSRACFGPRDGRWHGAGAGPEPAPRSLEQLAAGLDPDGPAYLFFTSGSTGVPKGVLGRHRGLAHFLDWQGREHGVGPGDRSALLTGLSFDVVLRDLYLPLLHGATLALPPADLETSRAPAWLRRAATTQLHVVPAVAATWLAEPEAELALPLLERVFFAGEPLPAALVEAWRRQVSSRAVVVNLYGPTETTLAKCAYRVPDPPDPGVQPVGRAMPQTQALVMAPESRLCGVGEPGEIVLRTPFRSLGYWRQEEETARRFRPNPAAPDGVPLYRSGDLGRLRSDGVLEILGRVDDQLKIRGVRVEPSEVAAVLAEHGDLESAFVLGTKDPRGENVLVAYYVAETASPGGPRDSGDTARAAALAAFLGERLPPAMVPAAFVRLDRLPLGANGKVDRGALPAPPEPPAATDAPVRLGEIERLVAEAWSEVLGRPVRHPDERFFDLGGHSLSATQVVSRLRRALDVELPLRAFFAEPTVGGVARWIERERAQSRGLARPELMPLPAGSPRPLSFAQQRLWLLSRLDEQGAAAYNLVTALSIRGRLDALALTRALAAVVGRHETLRSRFPEVDGEPSLEVAPAAPALGHLARWLDLGSLDPESRAAEAARLRRLEAARPFSLETGPVFRMLLLRLAPEEHQLVSTLHHIATDAWSSSVLVREVSRGYAALAGSGSTGWGSTGWGSIGSGEPRLSYGDFAAWQRDWLRGDGLEPLLAFWRRELAGAPLESALPADHPGRQHDDAAAGLVELDLGPAAAWQRLAGRRGATPFMALLAAFQVLLWRYTGQGDLLLGTPVANRSHRELEDLIGFFVDTLVMRGQVRGEASFAEHLDGVRERALAALAHQDLPFERLVEDLKPPRDLARTPLFQIMFAVQNAPQSRLELPGLALEAIPAERPASMFELSLTLLEDGAGWRSLWEYDPARFERVSVERWARSWATLLAGIDEPGALRLRDLPLLSAAEAQQLRLQSTGRRPAAGGEAAFVPVHEVFARRAREAPAAPAVEAPDGALGAGELAARAHRLARHLKRLGVAAEDHVAVLFERSLDRVVAFLAVLETGAVYLPLDPSYPPERLAAMLADTACRWGLSHRGLPARLGLSPEASWLEMEGLGPAVLAESAEPLGTPIDPRQLVCTLFTSGSTGRPKAVALEHGALAGYLTVAADAYGFSQEDRCLQFASVSFDTSLEEMGCALVAGSTLVLRSEEMAHSLARFQERVEAMEITLLDLPTAFFHEWVEDLLESGQRVPASVRRVILGGEELQPDRWQRWRQVADPAVRLFNTYGPAEATIVTTAAEPGAGPALAPGARVPIGRPLPGLAAYVVDERLELLPPGALGELAVGGGGLARGYLGRPAATAERFRPDPCSSVPGARLYLTGDRVRFLPSGELEFVGRVDRQVKIRGQRLEPGEVEVALRAQPGVRDAVVAVAGTGSAAGLRLVAFLVAQEGTETPDPAGIAASLAARLPAFMVPSRFEVLAELPMTPGGKVDRLRLDRLASSLGDLAGAAGGGGAEIEAPLTAAESTLAELWRDLLGVERIRPGDDFFSLGGHSLAASRLAARLSRRLGRSVDLRLLFGAPTLAGMAAALAATAEVGGAELAPVVAELEPAVGAEGGAFPLSFGQARLWFLHRLDPASPAYNMPLALALDGPLAARGLAATLASLLERHEVLRTVYRWVDGEPSQQVQPVPARSLPVVDLGDLSPAARAAEAEALRRREAGEPFDLARGPVLRARLLRLGPAEHQLCLSVHHIASDGWSQGVMIEELSAGYRRALEGESPLPPSPLQYRHYALWQRRTWESGAWTPQLEAWRQRLATPPEPLDLPLDRPRREQDAGRGGLRRHRLGADLERGVAALARGGGATPFMVLLAAFGALLSRLSGQRSFAVASPIAGRGRPELEPLIGFFVNTLVLRAELDGRPGFSELVSRARQVVLDASASADVPFERLVEELRPERRLERAPLAQVLLSLDNTPQPEAHLPGLAVRELPYEEGWAKLELMLFAAQRGEGLELALQYNRDLFDGTTAARLLGQLENLLRAGCAEPRRPFTELALLGPGERHQVLVEANDTAAAAPPQALHEPFLAQAGRTPEATAVAAGDEHWSYGHLRRQAAALARGLHELGLEPEERVAVCLARGPRLVAALLGILEAGGAYLPLDPAYPAARLELTLSDAAPRLLLTEAALLAPGRPLGTALAGGEQGPRVLTWEAGLGRPAGAAEPAGLAPAPDPEALAYLIYTSGSTGRPKAVAIRHGSASALVAWSLEQFPLETFARTLFSTSICFDLSVFELFVTLACGGTLVVVDDALSVLGEPASQTVSLINTVPSAMEALVQARAVPASVRTVCLAGEPLPARLVDDLWAHTRASGVWNLYGPSEDTTYSTFAACPPGEPPTIGRPLAGTRALLLDDDLQPVPTGAPAQLFLAGVGLARGYLGWPRETARRFLPCALPLAPGERMYATGDLARRRPDGRLDFLGRGDHQVKLRGFRIELGDVEAALLREPGVAEVCVVARGERGAARLVAYFAGAAEPEPLAAGLAERLPRYMVPSLFQRLEALPRTANGKVDRKRLPEAAAPTPAVEGAFAPAETSTERALTAIFEEVLGTTGVGVLDDFFALGGHSLLAVRVVEEVHARLGVRLALRSLFEHPCIRDLATLIERGGSDPEAGWPRLRRELEADAELPAEITAEGLAGARLAEPGTWLLTGATGFVGTHLLADLLAHTGARVVCLVRGGSRAEAEERLRRSLARHGGPALDLERIEVVPGDLGAPGLGLAPELHAELAGRVEGVIHNGAQVNVSLPYPALRATNVGGTVEVLRFATRERVKPVVFVSTLSVFWPESCRHAPVLREDDPLELGEQETDGGSAGYEQSKWVAERLVAAAARRGVPVSVVRFGRVGWSSRSGAWNPGDALYLALQACADAGAAPDVAGELSLLPVDWVARAITEIARRPAAGLRTCHLVPGSGISWRRLLDEVDRAGAGWDRLELGAWLERVRGQAAGGASPAALAVLALAGGGAGTEPGADPAAPPPNTPLRVDDRQARALLAAAGLAPPPGDLAGFAAALDRHLLLSPAAVSAGARDPR